jgi:AcrR family transcriptional regulator
VPPPSAARTKRPYNSTRRSRQAAQTRADVLAAAIHLFSTQGWAGTTLGTIAEAAGVSVETIYNGLREAMDVAVVGDAEPVPFVERDEFLTLGEGTLDERIERGVAVATTIHERTSGVWQAMVEAACSDDEIDEWRRQLEVARRGDLGRSVEAILGRAVDDTLLALLWVLFSPDTYRKLVHDDGLSRAEFEALLADGTKRLARVESTR